MARKQRGRRGERESRKTATIAVIVIATAAAVAIAWWWFSSQSSPAKGAMRERPAASPVLLEPPRPPNLEQLDPRMQSAVFDALHAVKSEPGNDRVWGLLGNVYHAHSYFELARQCYQRARKLDPADAAWPYYLGVFAWERGELEKAIELLRAAKELDPEDPPTRYRLGDALLRAGHLDAAESEFLKYSDLTTERSRSERIWGHLGLARVRRAQEDWPSSVRHLEAARREAPNHYEASYLLAESYRQLGRDEESRALLDSLDGSARRVFPDPRLEQAFGQRQDLQRLIAGGNQKLAEGDPEGAEDLYRQVLEFDPDHFDALFNLGVLYGRAERFAEAREVLDAATKVQTDHTRARFLLALSQANVGEIEEARTNLERLLRDNPGDPEARGLLSQLPP